MKIVGERFIQGGRAYYPCVCFCGQKVSVRTDKFSQRTKCSCENQKRSHVSNRGAYKSWQKMRDRCGKDKTYHARARYVGRGITVCERWQSFDNFFADMGPRPAGASLDRIDNDKGYSKENCRWADRRTQTLNSTHARFIEFRGRKMCLKDWARESGVNYITLWERLDSGWDFEKSITTPTRKWPGKTKEKP